MTATDAYWNRVALSVIGFYFGGLALVLYVLPAIDFNKDHVGLFYLALLGYTFVAVVVGMGVRQLLKRSPGSEQRLFFVGALILLILWTAAIVLNAPDANAPRFNLD